MNSGFNIYNYSALRELEHLSWKKGTESVIFESSFFDILSTQYSRDDGRSGDYLRISCSDWVNICALHKNSRGEDCLIMVRQFRHGSEEIALETPGGVVNRNENKKDAALRELHEETGFRAGKIELIGSSSPNAALMGNKMHVFLAQNLHIEETRALDQNEVMDVELVPIALIEDGLVPEFLVNGIMTIAWHYFSLWMKKKD